MTEEQEETINRLEKLINIRKNKAGQIKYDNCICSTTDIETVLNLLKEKGTEINKYCDKNMDYGECEDCIKQYFERIEKNERI